MMQQLLAALLLLIALPRFAWAGGVVAISDERVAQYREALDAAKELLSAARVLDPNASDIADQLKRADPAVVLAVGQKALQAAKSAAPNLPTVYCLVLGAHAAASRTVTGVGLEVAPAGQLEQLRQVAPSAKRIGIIYDLHASGGFIEEAGKAAARLGLTLVLKPVTEAKEVRGALSEIAGGIDALWLMPDPRLITAEMFSFLLVFTLERKIALFGFLDSFTQAGALASVAPDYKESGRRAARLALELANRPPDARVPVPPPLSGPGALTVNMKTAKRLGIDISAGVLGKARQVYR
jgi:putative ABC transport system substrate-binding protein